LLEILGFKWANKLIEAAGERSITREDYGGLAEEDTMEVLSKQIEETYFE
jgi:ABC-type bacteriocin/lantibiotic exporter with double-glycine peptidase domain